MSYYRWALRGRDGTLRPLINQARALVRTGEPAQCGESHAEPAPKQDCACGWYATRNVRILATYWLSRKQILLAVEPYGRCLEDRHGTVRSEYQHIYWAAVPSAGEAVPSASGAVPEPGSTSIDGVPVVDRDPGAVITQLMPPKLIRWIGRELTAADQPHVYRWGVGFDRWQRLAGSAQILYAIHALRGTRLPYTVEGVTIVIGRGRRRAPVSDLIPEGLVTFGLHSVTITAPDGVHMLWARPYAWYRALAHLLNGRRGYTMRLPCTEFD
jgi:hypothetical protein